MSRFKKPPTPDEWAKAAAECLRENDIDAQVGPGPSGSTRITVRLFLGGREAYLDAYHTLRLAAPGNPGVRERALEVLHGAGFVDGYRAGATGGMRIQQPADLPDAPVAGVDWGEPLSAAYLPRGMTGGPSRPSEHRTPLRTHPARPAPDGQARRPTDVAADLRAACDLGAAAWETERESIEALMREAADLLERHAG